MNIIAPIPALQKRIKELEEEVLRLRQQREMPLTRNWRLYWRSYQKSREKAPKGALVLYVSTCCVFPCATN